MLSSPSNPTPPKRVLICLSGSIAAYKIADAVSTLAKEGFEIQCLLTPSAREFVSPLVLETLSGRPALSELFGPSVSGTEHIRLARWPDLIVFAPASADLVARLRLGLSGDLVTTVALAAPPERMPWLIAPAMNTSMWENPVTQEHLSALEARGARVLNPADGILACGEQGAGKLAPIEELVSAIKNTLSQATLLKTGPFVLNSNTPNARLLITAGPTTTWIDAVRYITNPSTGRMGAAIAEAAESLGFKVDYVLGVDKGVVRPTFRSQGHRMVEVESADQMLEASLKMLPEAVGVVATAAVMDYQVAAGATGKLKRADQPVTLDLIPSVDVLGSLRAAAAPHQWFLGFAAETDSVEENALKKLKAKALDYLFANPIASRGQVLKTGFAGAQNAGTLLTRDGGKIPLPLQSKPALAKTLLEHVLKSRKNLEGDLK